MTTPEELERLRAMARLRELESYDETQVTTTKTPATTTKTQQPITDPTTIAPTTQPSSAPTGNESQLLGDLPLSPQQAVTGQAMDVTGQVAQPEPMLTAQAPVPMDLPPRTQDFYGQDRDVYGLPSAPDAGPSVMQDVFYESRPNIGLLEYQDAVRKASGYGEGVIDRTLSLFDKSMFFPALNMAFGGDEDSQIASVLENVPGAVEGRDPNTGRRYVKIGDKEFEAESLVPILSDLTMFAPVGLGKTAVTLPGKLWNAFVRMSQAAGIATTRGAVRGATGGNVDPAQIALETLGQPAGEAIAWAAKGAAKGLMNKIVNQSKGFTSMDVKLLEKAVANNNQLLRDATDAIDARNSLVKQMGKQESELPMYIQDIDRKLSADANDLWRGADNHSNNLKNAIDRRDKGLSNLVSAFLQRSGSVRKDVFPHTMVQKSLEKSREFIKKQADAVNKALFKKFRESEGELDVSSVLDVIDESIKTQTVTGKKTGDRSILERARYIVEPLPTQKEVDVPLIEQLSTVVGSQKGYDVTKGVAEEVKSAGTVIGSIVDKKFKEDKFDLIEGQKFIEDLVTKAQQYIKKGEGIAIDPITGEPMTQTVKKVVGSVPSSKQKTISVKKQVIDPITGKGLTKKELVDVPTTMHTDIQNAHNISKYLGELIEKTRGELRPTDKNITRMLRDVKAEFDRLLNDAVDGLGDKASAQYRKMIDELTKFDKNRPGQIVKLQDDQLKEVGDLIFDKNYVVGEGIDPSFKYAIELIRHNDPSALKDLQVSQINNMLKTIEKVSDEQFTTSPELFKMFQKNKDKLRLLKDSFNNKEQADTLQSIIELSRLAAAGRGKVGSASARATPDVGMYSQSFSPTSSGATARVIAGLMNFFSGKYSEAYRNSIAKILTSPDDVWYPELIKAVNKVKHQASKKHGTLDNALPQLMRLLDDYEGVERIPEDLGFTPSR